LNHTHPANARKNHMTPRMEFQCALLDDARETLDRRADMSCVVCGRESPQLTSYMFYDGESCARLGILVPRGQGRIFSYRICESCFSKIQRRNSRIFECLTCRLLDPTSHDQVVTVDVDPAVLDLWPS
jgi:hypothetical protein